MIYEKYPNPTKPASPPIPVIGGYVDRPIMMENGYARTWNEKRAKDKGCTPEEYAYRDRIYKEAAKKCDFKVYEIVYPSEYDQWIENGSCRVTALVDSYANADAAFDESLLYIVEVRCLKSNKNMKGTINYYKRIPPTAPTVLEESANES